MKALDKFEKNYGDVEILFEIHGALTDGIQGKNRHLTPTILKSSVLLMCASFEAFIEDVCEESVAVVAAHVTDSTKLPATMKAAIGRRLKEDKDDKSPWALAGVGWKSLYVNEARLMCDGQAGGLNTPSPKNIRLLFKHTLGINDITKSWSWQKMVPEGACEKLQELIRIRGQLAHGKGESGLNISKCRTHAGHIKKLVELVNVSCADAVANLLAP